MNKNIIEAIADRGGSDGWNITNDALTKSFTFDSFEQGQHFCDAVSQFANTKDHHPEWSLSNRGTRLDVKLTSHFANNTVTRLDFELAEAMNKQHAASAKAFNMYPRFESDQLVSLQIGALLLLCGGLTWKVATYNKYETRSQDPALTPQLPEDLVKFNKLPKTQMEASNVSTRLALAT